MKSKPSFYMSLLAAFLLSSCNFGEVSQEKFEGHISNLSPRTYTKVVATFFQTSSMGEDESGRQILTYDSTTEAWVHHSGDEMLNPESVNEFKVSVLYPELQLLYDTSEDNLHIHYYINPIKVVIEGYGNITTTVDEQMVVKRADYHYSFICNNYGWATNYRMEMKIDSDYIKIKYTFAWS